MGPIGSFKWNRQLANTAWPNKALFTTFSLELFEMLKAIGNDDFVRWDTSETNGNLIEYVICNGNGEHL